MLSAASDPPPEYASCNVPGKKKISQFWVSWASPQSPNPNRQTRNNAFHRTNTLVTRFFLWVREIISELPRFEYCATTETSSLVWSRVFRVLKGVQELRSIFLISEFAEKIANFEKSTDITAKSAVSRRFQRYTTCYTSLKRWT